MSVREIPLLIAGERRWGGSRYELQSPGTGTVVARVAEATAADVESAVAAAAAAAPTMEAMPAHRRAEILRQAAALLKERRLELARVTAEETGKTLKDALGELDRAWEATAFAADASSQAIGEVLPAGIVPHGEGRVCFTMRVPVGVVAGITPFNAPVSVGCHKIAPAIAGGNTVVLKPAPVGATASLMLVELFHAAGLPPGALNLVHGGPAVGAALTTHPLVSLINFTGGGRAADAIIRQAGMKRTVLELGGNAATIIHRDANVAKAIPACAVAAFGLTGQSCISLQRIYVHRDLMDQVTTGMVEAARRLKVGEPLDPESDIGPLINEDSARRIEQWVREAEGAGAQVLCGGRRNGSYFEPTVVVDVKPDMQLVCNEIFGPVVTIVPYDDIDDALNQTNDSPWGLQVGIYTASLDLALKAARALKFGGVMVNAPSRFRVENQPYGGVKASGWGREGARYAIEDMTDLRTVLIGPAE